MTKKIYAKAPTRVDLAGGTLDLWPLYAFLGECYTLNMAIDIFTHAILCPREDKRISLFIKDIGAKIEFENLEACLADPNEKYNLLKAHIQFWKPQFGFDLTTSSESPIGGGLGGSSSLSVSLTGAFSAWLGKKLTTEQMVRIVSKIEAQVLKVPTGTQDYFPAILGGLNALKYTVEGCEVKPLKYESSLLRESFLLVYTGSPHQSGFNNWKVLKDFIDGNQDTKLAMVKLQKVSNEMLHLFSRGEWGGRFKELLNLEYDARVQVSPVFASAEIDRLRKASLRAGAEAVKICGAGGGGCVLVWCPKGLKEKVASECRREKFQVLEASPIDTGLQVQLEN